MDSNRVEQAGKSCREKKGRRSRIKSHFCELLLLVARRNCCAHHRSPKHKDNIINLQCKTLIPSRGKKWFFCPSALEANFSLNARRTFAAKLKASLEISERTFECLVSVVDNAKSFKPAQWRPCCAIVNSTRLTLRTLSIPVQKQYHFFP